MTELVSSGDNCHNSGVGVVRLWFVVVFETISEVGRSVVPGGVVSGGG